MRLKCKQTKKQANGHTVSRRFDQIEKINVFGNKYLQCGIAAAMYIGNLESAQSYRSIVRK